VKILKGGQPVKLKWALVIHSVPGDRALVEPRAAAAMHSSALPLFDRNRRLSQNEVIVTNDRESPMSSLAAFARRLLNAGEIRLTERPRPSADQRAGAAVFLADAYADYRLEIAGPALPFDADSALAACEVVRLASWYLVSHQEPAADLEQCLTLPEPPHSAARQLSADLTLRYLPQLHRRARAMAPDDPLTERLATLLRQWPLSGVLADLAEPPLTDLDFDGHPGLMLLYAERLADNHRRAWTPEGRTLEFADWVFQEQGKEQKLRQQAHRPQPSDSDEGDTLT
jgi:hypothetical protein